MAVPHALLITYEVDGTGEAEFRAARAAAARAADASPGLLARVALSDPETHTYGEFSVCQDEAAMHRYMQSVAVRRAVGPWYVRDVHAHTFAAGDVVVSRDLTARARVVPGPDGSG